MPFFGDIAKTAKGATTEGELRKRIEKKNPSPKVPQWPVPSHRTVVEKKTKSELTNLPLLPPPSVARLPLFRHPSSDLISGGFAYDNKYTCDVKNVSGTPLRLSGAVVQKNGERDPTGTVKVTVDHPKGLVLESEAAVPSGKISGTLSYAGAIPGFKAGA